jgi:hypothetical protein
MKVHSSLSKLLELAHKSGMTMLMVHSNSSPHLEMAHSLRSMSWLTHHSRKEQWMGSRNMSSIRLELVHMISMTRLRARSSNG